jgi:hypothetical protein
MPLDEVVRAAKDGNPIKNGAIITLVFETGTAASGLPEINQFVPSGTMQTRLQNRFDEHYGGGAS